MVLLTRIAYKAVRYSGIPWIFREFVQRHKVTLILFHDIRPDLFEQHLRYLLKHYQVISLQQYFNARKDLHLCLPPKSLVITLDDGLKGNYHLLPVIQKYKVPVTIFLCSSIIGTQRRYWTGVTVPGYSVEDLKCMPASQRDRLLRESGFDPLKESAFRESLGLDEIMKMSDYVDFQSHTRFHAILPLCGDSQAEDEIITSKLELEAKLHSRITSISYPNGDYSARDLNLARKGGYALGITVDFGFNTIRTDPLRLRRLCISDDSSCDELIVKATGTWQFLKQFFKKEGYGYKEAIREEETPSSASHP
jgi:peptidoglycan/xylan/chitin deacetylase (PgdA/CDA1 family)